jgi:large subunit ribosomal protein L17
MRHQGSYRKFSRTPAHRRAMFRNLATSLVEHERFETTIQKAKELRRVVEKLVTMALVDNVANRRLALGYLTTKESVHKLFSEIAPRFKDRKGGYTRVIRTRVRAGDAAEMGMIEFLKAEGAAATKSASSKSGAAKKASSKSAVAKNDSAKEEKAKSSEKVKAPRAAKKKA